MAHWHDFNPWADSVVYLPDLRELSNCLDPNNPERQIQRWLREHPDGKLDAYLLRDGPNARIREIHCGIRYGKEGSEYYSPYINQYIAELLFNKYQNTGA